MTTELYKCCFCLETVKNPVVMCYQTHVGCFDCVCAQLRNSDNGESNCAMCRQPLHIRFDRLITESAKTMHRSKRKRTNEESAYEVFLKLLALKKKDRYRMFTRTIKRFATAATDEEAVSQMSTDMKNIISARISGQRLLEQKLYDPTLYAHI